MAALGGYRCVDGCVNGCVDGCVDECVMRHLYECDFLFSMRPLLPTPTAAAASALIVLVALTFALVLVVLVALGGFGWCDCRVPVCAGSARA